MENLAQIETIERKIKTASVASIKALHQFIFQQDGDRYNRKRLRAFTGFEFRDGSEEHTARIEYARRLTIGDLTSCCNILGLDYSGTKEEIIYRVCHGLMNLNSLIQSDEDDEDDEDNEDDADGVEVNETQNDKDTRTREIQCIEKNRRGTDEMYNIMHAKNDSAVVGRESIEQNNLKFAMSYRDIEDTIRIFDGGDTYPVERWLSDFEEAAALFGWSELQQIIFAKRSLTGLAKLVIQSEGVIHTWQKLKTALLDEFSTKINSAQLHEMLAKRKMKKEETVQEYYLKMKELATRGAIEPEALIQHVIDGIPDDPTNKIVLYGSTKLSDFKERLKVYETIRKKNQERFKFGRGKDDSTRRTELRDPKKTETPRRIENKQHQVEVICFNCGDRGHKSMNCENRALGKKCFKCKKFGHVAADCEDRRDDKPSSSFKIRPSVNNITMAPMGNMFKKVSVANVDVNALIDTGSQVSIMREYVYNKIDLCELRTSETVLTGFGKTEIKTLGYFQTTICIDDEDYPCTIYVVPNDSMCMDAVIGSDVLNLAEVKIDVNGITIRKATPTIFLFNINVLETNVLDVGENTSKKHRDEVEQLLSDYKPEKTKSTDVEMNIIVKEEEVIFDRPRRLPVAEREIVDKQVEDWIREGVVEPSTSEYASPVLVVRKKDGSPRVCIDYRRINRIILKDRYPLPLIEDQLDKLSNAKVFSTIDLKSGFFHVTVREESRKFTSFVTHNGQYQFLKVPFGLCNSPSVFQRFINCVFRPLTNRGIAIPYLDDIIIPGEDEDEAILRLEEVVQTAKEYGLEINVKKCQFLKRKVEFLGHVIEGGKIYPSPTKTDAVARFPKPTSIKGVHSFVGLTGYFRKFIPNYSIIAKPLSDMLKKDAKFQFQEREQTAFETLKELLTRKPVLNIYNAKYDTEVHTDASREGYGAILLQKTPTDDRYHPVYYMSKKTTAAEKNYSSYELEVLAVIGALKRFRVYLLGIKFNIVTDCQAFQKTMNKKDLATRVARWALLLEEFDYTIEHRSGSRMKHVDALSRHPVMFVRTDGVLAKVRNAQREDDAIKTIKELLKERPYEDYFVKDDVLYKFSEGRELLVVPRSMQSELIRQAHEKGHFATKRTEEILKQDYYIPKLTQKIERLIANCVACILVNKKAGKQEGCLHPLFKETVPLYTYHVDHLGPLESTSKQYKHIFAIIDSFTKFVWLYPTKSTTAAEAIKNLEIQKVAFGNPCHIVTDRGTAFTATEFEDYCQKENIKHSTITTGLPRANGQVERLNRIIISALSKLSVDDPSKWYKYVNDVQRAINSTYQRSINTTPFELLMGTKMRGHNDLRLKQILEDEVLEDFETARNELRREAKIQILKVQEENRRTYNLRRRRPNKYKIGDLVAIKRTQLGPGLKLKRKYLGPYSVIKVKGRDTYDVCKDGTQEGPMMTSTCAEFMKPWIRDDMSSETDDL